MVQPRLKKQRGDFQDSTVQTQWRSLYLNGVITFFISIQFSVFFSFLWQFLLQHDPTIEEGHYGVIVAVYSLGMAVASPLYGFWEKKTGTCRPPVMTGLAMMMTGNLLFLAVPLLPFPARHTVLVSRLIMGIGGGNMANMRGHAIAASTSKDRTRAFSISIGAFAMGLTLGPAVQLLYTSLGYEGYELFLGLRLSMFTAPVISCLVANVLSMITTFLFLEEGTAGLYKIDSSVAECDRKYYALPKYDLFPVLICVYIRFCQFFLLTILETIGPSMTMTMFNWTKQESVFWNAVMYSALSFVSFVIYVLNTLYNFGKIFEHRIWTLLAIAALILFHVITYPYDFLDGKIDYQHPSLTAENESIVELVGCRPNVEWCSYTPRINVYVFAISQALLVGFSFSFINVSMTAVYSAVLGPRNQASWQGIMVFMGSLGRMIGPFAIANLYEVSGPKACWKAEIAVMSLALLLWILSYRRQVPLKTLQDIEPGGDDFVRNKFGAIYRF